MAHGEKEGKKRMDWEARVWTLLVMREWRWKRSEEWVKAREKIKVRLVIRWNKWAASKSLLWNDDKLEWISSAPLVTPDHLLVYKHQPRARTLGTPPPLTRKIYPFEILHRKTSVYVKKYVCVASLLHLALTKHSGTTLLSLHPSPWSIVSVICSFSWRGWSPESA